MGNMINIIIAGVVVVFAIAMIVCWMIYCRHISSGKSSVWALVVVSFLGLMITAGCVGNALGFFDSIKSTDDNADQIMQTHIPTAMPQNEGLQPDADSHGNSVESNDVNSSERVNGEETKMRVYTEAPIEDVSSDDQTEYAEGEQAQPVEGEERYPRGMSE